MARSDHRWRVRSGKIDVVVTGYSTQWEAYDQIADRPLSDFGLIVQAEHNEDCEPIAIRTSALMFRWNRHKDAARAISAAVAAGLPDSTESDKKFATREQ